MPPPCRHNWKVLRSWPPSWRCAKCKAITLRRIEVVHDHTFEDQSMMPCHPEQYQADLMDLVTRLKQDAEWARTSPGGKHPHIDVMTHAAALRYAAELCEEYLDVDRGGPGPGRAADGVDRSGLLDEVGG